MISFVKLLSVFLISTLSWGRTYNSTVIDEAQLFKPEEIQQLDQVIRSIQQTTGAQIGLITLSSLNGDVIENVSIKIAEEWKLGEEKLDNGLLIVIAPVERKMRIEVGYGLEDKVTDFDSSAIIRNTIKPAFKEGAYFVGIKLALNQIESFISGKVSEEEKTLFRKRANKGNFNLNSFLLPLIIFLVLSAILHQKLKNKPALSGLFSGVSSAGLGAMALGAFSIPALILFFVIGFVVGMIGIHNLLYALGSSHGGGHGGRSGGGGWSGGGGSFGGGGSSGDW
jgi:uncharacterized protein